MIFNNWTELCIHHHNLVLEISITQEDPLNPLILNLLSYPRPQATTTLLSVSKDLSFLDIYHRHLESLPGIFDILFPTLLFLTQGCSCSVISEPFFFETYLLISVQKFK